MTNDQLVDFFINKLDKLTSFASLRIFVAHRLPMFKEAQTLNKWRLIIILSGERFYRFANGKQLIEKTLVGGDILLVEPFSCVWCEEDQTYDMLSIVSNPSAIRFISKQRQKGISLPREADEVLHGGQAELKCFQLLLEALDKVLSRKQCPDISPLLKFIWSECYAAVRSGIYVRQSGAQYLLGNIIAYIGEHLTEDVSCSRLSKEFGVSPNYIAQIFAREMSYGVSKYVSIQRLELARQLLKNSKMNIGEIADYCGYNQTNYFIRIYKKKYGHTPLTYRTSQKSIKQF